MDRIIGAGPGDFEEELVLTTLRPRNLQEVLRPIRDRASARPQGSWIQANGFSEYNLEEKRFPLRWEIDDSGAPFLRPLPTPIATPQGVTFRPPTDILPTAF